MSLTVLKKESLSRLKVCVCACACACVCARMLADRNDKRFYGELKKGYWSKSYVLCTTSQ